jgi:hypothetical protein
MKEFQLYKLKEKLEIKINYANDLTTKKVN